MKSQDPPRWLSVHAADSELGQLLRAGSQELAPADVLERSARHLSTVLGASVAAHAATAHAAAANVAGVGSSTAPLAHGAQMATQAAALSSGAHAGLASLVVKSAVVLAVAVGATTVAVLANRTATSTSSSATTSSATSAHAPATTRTATAPTAGARQAQPASSTALPFELPASDEASVATDRIPVTGNGVAAGARHHATGGEKMMAPSGHEPDGVRAAEELHALEDAKRRLEADPARLLAELRVQSARFPDGWLAQERAALEIDALLRVGDLAQARLALDRFGKRYPKSPSLQRLHAAQALAGD